MVESLSTWQTKTFTLYRLEDTRKLAEMLALRVSCGDVITLAGDLGAGKTTFAQFFIQALSSAVVEVTSPTFTLLQTYPVVLADGVACELYHYDLYRVEHPSELRELGLEEAVTQVALIEWPERLAGISVPVTLALTFTHEKNDVRQVRLTGDLRWNGITL